MPIPTDCPHPRGITPDARHLLTATPGGDVRGWKLPEPAKEQGTSPRP
jgi:hypothetical protein